MTDSIARGRSACGKKTIYSLGKGGMYPDLDHPSNNQKQCDCSGFVSWCLGVSRYVQHGHPWEHRFLEPWISTTSIFEDAKNGEPDSVFKKVDIAQPGDVIVYPDHDGGQGHVGLISEAREGVPIKVIHCSNGNFKNLGDAIQETTVADYWKKNGAIFARVQA